MGDLVRVRGAVTALPPTAASPVSGDLGEVGELDERLLVGAKLNLRLVLTADAARDVPILAAAGGPFVAGAHVLVAKVVGGKVTATLSTLAGAYQSVPVDGVLLLISETDPVTTLYFTRTPGVATTVKLFLAEKL